VRIFAFQEMNKLSSNDQFRQGVEGFFVSRCHR
jgi:hypothetical protein